MELKTYFAQDRAGNIIPNASVKIFLTGTTVLASGLVDVSGNPLSNPFTATVDGKIQFRAPDGIYDMQVSFGDDTGITVTFQCVDINQMLTDASSAAGRAESAAASAEQALSDFEAERSTLASLDSSGKIPVEQIPAIALTETFRVNSQAAMLALVAQPGDVAIRTDISKTFQLQTAPASTLANWTEFLNDALAQLGQKNGMKLIGECADIATLRTTEPDAVGQLIRVKNYYSDKFGGGGLFRSVTPGSLVDDGGLYIKTTGGAVWRRCVKNKQVSTEDYGCWDGNTGPDNTARLVKACASGLDVKMMGENYNVTTIPNSNFALTGKMKASTSDFSTAYGRTLLTITGTRVSFDIDIDMQNFGAGGFINLGTDTVGTIKVSNIYGANRTTYGLQNAVSDGGTRNVMTVVVRNVKKGDSGVDPQPAAFTVYGSKGNYPLVDMYDSQGGIIGSSTDEAVFGEIIARLVHDNGFYALENSRQTIGTMVCDNVLGEPFVNAGGISTIGTMKLKECQGFGITYSYSGRLRIDHLVLEQTLVSSAMPLLRSRPDNVNSVVSIGKIEGSFVLGATTASINNSLMSVNQGLTDLSIGNVDLRLFYVAGSYLGLADFSACSRIVLGDWNIAFVDNTGALTSANIAFIALPTTAQAYGSKVGMQCYTSTSATVRMTNISNETIMFHEGQPLQVNAGPYISSQVSYIPRVFYANAIPTAGKWTRGDEIRLTAPTTAVPLGYRCITSGTFGSGTDPVFQVI